LGVYFLNNVITNNADDVFGKVFLEFYENKGPLYYFFERDDGLLQYRLSETYFQDYDLWNKDEQSLVQTIIDNNIKTVLDIGAGAGRTSLFLQNRGIDVVALDISPGAIEVCQRRGIKKVFQGDIFNYNNFHSFDCVLLLGNNLAIGGNYDGTKNLLHSCKELIKPSGYILLHFLSPTPTEDIDHLVYHELNKSREKRVGEITTRIRYRTLVSSWFQLFLPTEKEFNEIIDATGLKIEKKWNNNENSYYVQLGIL